MVYSPAESRANVGQICGDRCLPGEMMKAAPVALGFRRAIGPLKLAARGPANRWQGYYNKAQVFLKEPQPVSGKD